MTGPTILLARLKLEPPPMRYGAGEKLSALAWEELIRRHRGFDVLPSAMGPRRVVLARSHTAPRFRLPRLRLSVALAPLVIALYRTALLAHPSENNHVVNQQIPSDHDFVEVALYEPCESQASDAVRYRRERGLR